MTWEKAILLLSILFSFSLLNVNTSSAYGLCKKSVRPGFHLCSEARYEITDTCTPSGGVCDWKNQYEAAPYYECAVNRNIDAPIDYLPTIYADCRPGSTPTHTPTLTPTMTNSPPTGPTVIPPTSTPTQPPPGGGMLCWKAVPDDDVVEGNTGTRKTEALMVFGATKVIFNVKSSGNNDWVRYEGVNISGRTWEKNIPLANHPGDGLIEVHVYLEDGNGNSKFCDTANFYRRTLNPPSPPTVSLPVCANGSYVANFSWTGDRADFGFYLDVDDQSDQFNHFYNKNVPEGYMTDSTNLNGFNFNGTLILNPGITYYARVYNGKHGGVTSFKVPQCAGVIGRVVDERDGNLGSFNPTIDKLVSKDGSPSCQNSISLPSWYIQFVNLDNGYIYYVDGTACNPQSYYGISGLTAGNYKATIIAPPNYMTIGGNPVNFYLSPGETRQQWFHFLGQPQTPTVTVPSCSSAPYNPIFSWEGPPHPDFGFYLDASDNPNFGSFYNKLAGKTNTTDGTGFLGIWPSQNQPLVFWPNGTGYIRVYNGRHSGASSFFVPSCTLTANLTANPPSGPDPLNVMLTATTGGDETGTINYNFWWHCPHATNSVGEASALCGSLPSAPLGQCTSNANGVKCEAVNDNPKSIWYNYTPNGTYTAKVIIERGATAPAEARANIVVSKKPNGAPSAFITSLTPPNYCISSPGETVSWSYSDPEGTPQSAYRVQIDNDPNFTSPKVDSQKVNSADNSAYFTGLSYDQKYFARVMVWDGDDTPSFWSNAIDFFTPAHAAPIVQFDWNPASPAIRQQVTFRDNTSTEGVIVSRNWNFNCNVPTECQIGSSGSQNPQNKFYRTGGFSVVLTATDEINNTCATTRTINIGTGRKPPVWKEVAPQ